MLEIDYSLIPLSGEDRHAVDKEVARQLAAGIVPKLDKSHFGRVVVLNPDPVQTTHHISDDLRAYLRRSLQHTTEGQTNLRADRLLRDLEEPEEPLHILILELKNDFGYLKDFMECLPRLRQRYPDIGVFLNTDQATAMARLPEMMGNGAKFLQLFYPDARGTIEIDDPGELSQVISDVPDPVVFSIPFFSQIRLNLPDSKEPVAFNLDSLRSLAPQYGSGKVREIDLAGRKEKVIVIDLPLRIIRDFQFRQNLGFDFQGIVQEGRKILTRNFSKQKLEYRWIPLRSVEGFIHREPGGKERIAEVASTAFLRVNTFNGEVTFVNRSVRDQISLQDVSGLGFRNAPGKNGSDAPALGEGDIEHSGGVYFDRVIIPGGEYTDEDPVQDAIREHIYGRRLRGDAEQQRKLEIYTSGINVGAVGPLAGQTLKILRRHGLERLIDPKSFHYLCDLPQQLPQYHLTAARFEAHFANLVNALKKLMADDGSDHMRLRDSTHNLPVTCEWVDARELLFERIRPEELETVYKEMQILIGFIGQEFRRNFVIGKEEIAFFNKIRDAEAVALQARWMADYKRGSYGPPLQEGELPDFVFFGTPQDKLENDKRYFFPSFACTELVVSESSAKLFSNVDYGFSVFLEEKMALAEHFYRQQGQLDIGSLEYEAYFDDKFEQNRQEIEDLKSEILSLDSVDSPEYQALLKEEEDAFQERYQIFLKDQEYVATTHDEVSAAFLKLARELAADLKLENVPADGSQETDHSEPPGFDRSVAAAVESTLRRKLNQLHGELGGVLGRLLESVQHMDSEAQQLAQAQQDQRRQVREQLLVRQAAQQTRVHSKVGERHAILQKMRRGEREALVRRVKIQLNQIADERLQLENREEQLEKRIGQSLDLVGKTVSQVLGEILELEKKIQPAKPREKRNQIASHMGHTERVFGSLRASMGRVNKGNGEFERYQIRAQKLATHVYTLMVESALLQAIADNKQPELPSPAAAAAQVEAVEDIHSVFQVHQGRLDAFESALNTATRGLASTMEDVDAHLQGFEEYFTKISELEQIAGHKERLRLSRTYLMERQQLMEEDLADLPNRVRNLFMPARKELLLKNFIPNAERTSLNFRRAKAFLADVFRLDHNLLQSEYLDRAVYRRFASDQFLRGAYIAVDNQVPKAVGLRNVLPAVNRLFRTLNHNFGKQHPQKVARISSGHLKTMQKNILLEYAQQWAAAPEKLPYDYIILPASLELAEAVEVMNYKDKLFRGIPRLVLVYVSKFSPSEILDNAALREDFFRAKKHNVIVNIDGHVVVDNPFSICHQLLQETLGSCFDISMVEELPEDDDETVVFKV